MLPQAGEPKALPYISGLGLAMGNILSVGIILFFLIALLLPATPFAGVGPIPTSPMFGLNPETHDAQRLSGPFVAVWMALLMIPFFLFMPDNKATGLSWKNATANFFCGLPNEAGIRSESFGERMSKFRDYLVDLFKTQPQVMRFLIARTIYADAMAALLTLGAVFARTFFGWSPVEILIFGLAGLIFGAIGGFVGGALDRWLGPKLALIVELSALIILLFIQLSITPQSLFFGLVDGSQPVWESPFFSTLSDVVYFSFIVPVAIAVVACISSSRYMLVHIAPPARIGEFFGLYAIAGTVTVWMGPGLVTLLTEVTGNQRIGMGGIGVMFLIGLFVLWSVKADKTPEHMKAEEDRY
ncbi:MAG: MFS transporter, partial [Pseudomonadota bacterium]